MSTDDNPAYGMSLPRGKSEYSKGDYEVPQYIQPPDTEEGVYEGVD